MPGQISPGIADRPGIEAKIGFPNAIAIGLDGAIYLNHSTTETPGTVPTAIP